MKPDVTLITAYRDSPLRVPLFERWIGQQTFTASGGSVEWIVVDDGDEPAPLTRGQLHLRRDRQPNEPDHTLGLNLRHAIPHAQADIVLFIESDDYYGPNYIAGMVDRLQTIDIFGTCLGLKYNVRDRRAWRNINRRHACLCSTGIRRTLFNTFSELCLTHNPFIDLELWRKHSDSGPTTETLSPGWPVSVGIKCLPGRTSIETMNGRMCRKTKATNGQDDSNLTQLRSWIGSDADAFAEFYKP